MMHSNRFMPVLWVSLFLFVFCGSAFAQGKSDDAKARHFGIGQPKSVQELPYGQLRKDLEKLSPKAQGKALGVGVVRCHPGREDGDEDRQAQEEEVPQEVGRSLDAHGSDSVVRVGDVLTQTCGSRGRNAQANLTDSEAPSGNRSDHQIVTNMHI